MVSVDAPTYAGSCHCGGVRFTVACEPVELTTCDCSLCVKRNALMVKVPEAALRLDQGQELLATYQWNSHRARHHFCRRCGIYVFHRKRAAPDHFGVNIFCLDGFDASRLPIRATEGRGMTLTSDDPRPEWPGPRAPVSASCAAWIGTSRHRGRWNFSGSAGGVDHEEIDLRDLGQTSTWKRKTPDFSGASVHFWTT